MKLEIENATFQSKLPELLLAYEGKYVLIYRSEIVDVFNHPASAIVVGYERFQLEPFLVKRVEVVEPPESLVTLNVENLKKALHPRRSRKLRAWILGVDVEDL